MPDAPAPTGPRSLYLIRHGQSVWNAAGRWQGAANPPLSELGRTQAEAVAHAFADTPLDAIVSSPQLRALDTAGPLARAQHLEVGVDEGLAEIDVGSWSGLSREEIEVRVPGSLAAYRAGHAPWESGERYEEHEARSGDAIRRVVGRPEQRIAVTSHGGTIRAMVRELLGVPHDLRHRFGGVGNGQIAELRQETPEAEWLLVAYGTEKPQRS